MITPDHFLEQIAAQATGFTFLYDYTNRVLPFISQSLISFLGVSPEEVKEQPQKLLEFVNDTDREYVQQVLEKLREQGPHAVDVEFRVFTPDQSLKWVRVRGYVVKDAAEERVMMTCFVEDITKGKEHQLSLYAIKEQKNIVVQMLGHDLRAPLTTISMSVDLLGREIDLTKNETVRQLVGIMERTCRNSLSMIKEVLNTEYLETQQMQLKKSRIDIISRMNNQIDTFRLLDKSAKVFRLHTEQETLFINTDSVRLMLIIENLLTNAFKFTDADGRIDVRVVERPQTLLISVSDNGIGIPDKLKPLVFDKFTKARRRGTQGEQPIGLGLHLIRTMIEQLDGRIWFESEEGKGSTFYVELPK